MISSGRIPNETIRTVFTPHTATIAQATARVVSILGLVSHSGVIRTVPHRLSLTAATIIIKQINALLDSTIFLSR